MKARFFGLVAVLAALTGCATPGKPGGDDLNRVAVEGAVVYMIEQSGRPAERAAEIAESIDRLQVLLTTGTSTTARDLRNALLKRVAERNLSVGEKALALQVVGRIADNVEAKIGGGFLSPDAIVSVERVLSWAENMAALYVQVTPDR